MYYLESVNYIDPKTNETSNFAAPISCDKNPQNVRALDFDIDDYFVLTPRPVLRAHLTKFWNRALFNKHSVATLKLLGKPYPMKF